MTRSVEPATFDSSDRLRRSAEPPELWLVRLFAALVLHTVLLFGVRSAWVKVAVAPSGEGGTVEFVEVGTVETENPSDSPKAEGVAPLRSLKPGAPIKSTLEPDQTEVITQATQLPSPRPEPQPSTPVEPEPAKPEPAKPEPAKPEVKPSASPVDPSKPVAPTKQPVAKPATKPAAKPATKPAAKPATKPATKPIQTIDRPVESGQTLPDPVVGGGGKTVPEDPGGGAPPSPLLGIRGQVEKRQLLSSSFETNANMVILDPLPDLSLPLTPDLPQGLQGQTVLANFIVVADAFKAGEVTTIVEVQADRTNNPLLKAGLSEVFVTAIGQQFLVGRQVKITLVEGAGDDPKNKQPKAVDKAASEWRVAVQIQFS